MGGVANMASQEGVTPVRVMKNIREMGCEPYMKE